MAKPKPKVKKVDSLRLGEEKSSFTNAVILFAYGFITFITPNLKAFWINIAKI